MPTLLMNRFKCDFLGVDDVLSMARTDLNAMHNQVAQQASAPNPR